MLPVRAGEGNDLPRNGYAASHVGAWSPGKDEPPQPSGPTAGAVTWLVTRFLPRELSRRGRLRPQSVKRLLECLHGTALGVRVVRGAQSFQGILGLSQCVALLSSTTTWNGQCSLQGACADPACRHWSSGETECRSPRTAAYQARRGPAEHSRIRSSLPASVRLPTSPQGTQLGFLGADFFEHHEQIQP